MSIDIDLSTMTEKRIEVIHRETEYDGFVVALRYQPGVPESAVVTVLDPSSNAKCIWHGREPHKWEWVSGESIVRVADSMRMVEIAEAVMSKFKEACADTSHPVLTEVVHPPETGGPPPGSERGKQEDAE